MYKIALEEKGDTCKDKTKLEMFKSKKKNQE
jgi:hypothetical protein